MFNNYNDNYNNSILNIFSEFNKNWIFPKTKTNLSNNIFKQKCDIKPCEKKSLIKSDNNYKSKSCSKLIKTYRTSINNSSFAYNACNAYNKYKTERKSKYNSAIKISRVNLKNRTARTTVRNTNKKGDKKYIMNSLVKNGKINWEDKIFNKQGNERFLTKNNFYPKSMVLNMNNEGEKICNENTSYNLTKTSFRNYRTNKDLNDSKSLKPFESQFNLYNFNSINKKVSLKRDHKYILNL